MTRAREPAREVVDEPFGAAPDLGPVRRDEAARRASRAPASGGGPRSAPWPRRRSGRRSRAAGRSSAARTRLRAASAARAAGAGARMARPPRAPSSGCLRQHHEAGGGEQHARMSRAPEEPELERLPLLPGAPRRRAGSCASGVVAAPPARRAASGPHARRARRRRTPASPRPRPRAGRGRRPRRRRSARRSRRAARAARAGRRCCRSGTRGSGRGSICVVASPCRRTSSSGSGSVAPLEDAVAVLARSVDDALKPVGRRPAVVVRERDERRVGGAPADVAAGRRARGRARPGRSAPLARPGAARLRPGFVSADDDDLEPLARAGSGSPAPRVRRRGESRGARSG